MPDVHPETTIARIVEHIVGELAHSLGQQAAHIDPHCPFVDMGADSLILAETLQDINRRYRVMLSVGEMYDSVNTIDKVARYLHANGQYEEALSASVPSDVLASTRGDAQAEAVPMAVPMPMQTEAETDSIEQIVRRQLELMERQLALLSGTAKAPNVIARAPASTRVAAPHAVSPAAPASMPADASPPEATGRDRFSAFAVRLEADQRSEDAKKVAHIAALAEQHNARTRTSKRAAQDYRRSLADNRVSAGFRPLLKELVYPVLAEAAQGAHLVDVDGNRYLDFTMGFGVHLFGHAPSFVVERVRSQLDRGMPIGPQSPMAGRVAELIAELTGHERVVFCNSGTEATMTAVRLARLAAGRDKLVIFKHSYHGSFDAFLARSAVHGITRPASPGTPESLVADTIVLDYCERASLDYIAAHHEQIGVVMVEPVQSRAPSLDPSAFLAQLREITRAHGIVLIFDEVISGFRCARGGAQEYFGVRADLCTYGKIIGGGMPIGVVAGTAACMDGIDGGGWQFGDNSYPEKPTIFFAGTFSKHPLTMAASLAVLEHLAQIEQTDPDFYPRLNEATRMLAERLIAVFEDLGVDITIEQFSSLFRFASKGNLDLFFYHLLANGIYIWEGRNCFVSAAHSAQDIDRLVDTVRDICRTLAPLELIPLVETKAAAVDAKGALDVSAVPLVPESEPIALSDAQRRFFELERSRSEGRIANNVSFAFRFDEPVDAERLAACTEDAIRAHDALGARFDLDSGVQTLGVANAFEIERIAHTRAPDAAFAIDLANREQVRPLLMENGQNARAQLHTFARGEALLTLSLHHLACDGWSLGVLLDEIARRYNGAQPKPAASYHAWITQEAAYRASERHTADLHYWTEAIERAVAYRAQATSSPVGHSDAISARPGARANVTLDAALSEKVSMQAKRSGVTTFTWLLACVQSLLSRVYSGRAPIIGLPFANRTAVSRELIGNCVNLPFVVPTSDASAPFDDVLATARKVMSELMSHSRFPYHMLCDLYRTHSPDRRGQPVEVTFNVEPLTQMPSFGGSTPVLVAPVNRWIEFDLMFNVFLLPDGIRIELDYNSDLFNAELAYGWLYLLAKLIENEASVATQPSALPA